MASLPEDIRILLFKDSLEKQELKILSSSILLDSEFEDEEAERYIYHNVLDEFTAKLLTKSLSEEAVRLLIMRNRVNRNFLPEFAALILKNYRQMVKELYTLIVNSSMDEMLKIIESPLFEEDYFIFLCRLMLNSEKFFKQIIDKKKFNIKTADIFSSSNNVIVLSMVYNNMHVVDDKKAVLEFLLRNPYLPDELKAQAGEDIEEFYKDAVKKTRELEENLYSMIKNMSMAKKIKLALKGNKSARALLIKDANKQVSGNVMNNPQITIDEIEFISKNKNTAEHIFRAIARNNEWMGEYIIVRSLVFNPRTPLDITVPLLYRLQMKDLEDISRSKDVASNLRSMGKRLLEGKQKKK